MTSSRRRLVSLALVLTMALTFLPLNLPGASADYLGIVTSSSVHVRKQASSNADIWFDLMQNHVCTILGQITSEGILWYKVSTKHPDDTSKTGNSYIGFIHSDYFRPLTDAEAASYSSSSGTQQTTVTTTATVTSVDSAASSGAIGVVTNGGTNFREGPSTKAHSMMKLDRNTEVELLTIPSVISSETFYQVRYQGTVGYIMSTFIRVVSGGTQGTVTQPTATPDPGTGTVVQPTATAAPAATAAVTYGGYTHVRLILTSCHLRTSPNGVYDRSKDWEGRGSVLPLAGNAVTSGGYTWYPVSKNNRVYYVRNDCVQPFNSGESTATAQPEQPVVTATPAPTSGSGGMLGYVQTIKRGCNLRATMGGTMILQIPKDVQLPYYSGPTQKGQYSWYYVEYNGKKGYLRNDVVKVISTVTAVPTSVPTTTSGSEVVPTATSGTNTDGSTGYLKTTASGINLRKSAGYTDVIGKVDRDVLLPYYGTPTSVSGVLWYYVYVPSYGYGYIHGGYVTLTDSSGVALPTATPLVTGSSSGGSTGTSSQQEASYTTLKMGSTGSAVKNLVTELKNQGYYSGSITNRYTSSVERAVRSFQSAKGLSVDGIAGAATQHALYGTVPIGAADTSNLTMTIYPAEKIDWYTGGINDLWPRGSNYKVYDVKTGIVWWAHRWAGGLHVDAEPLTAADTARLCKCYGVTTAQQIADKDLYERRPLLVTIGTRTFACSLYGVPHNYPEGDTISDNDFRGQLCIHFTNSRIHNSNKVDSGHEAAIQYAWEHAPNGHI